MRRLQSAPLKVPDVLSRIQAELDLPIEGTSSTERRLAQIRVMQREFRERPVGGRLLALKRLVYWFSASAFDRQAKVIESLLDVVAELVEENHKLALKLAQSSDFSESQGGHQQQ